jgi:hypothetical protein
MRSLFTFLIGVPYTALFCLLILWHSVTGFVADTQAIVGTFRDAQTYQVISESLSQRIEKSTPWDAASPAEKEWVQKFKSGVVRSVIEAVPEESFYGMIGTWHAGLAMLITRGTDESSVDFSGLKSKVLAYVEGFALERKAAEADLSQDLIAGITAMESGMRKAVESVPDRCTVSELLQKGGADSAKVQEELHRIHRNLETIRIGERVLLWLTGGLLLLTVLVNITSIRRMLFGVGFLLLISGAFYAGVERQSQAWFSQRIENALWRTEGDPEPARPGQGKAWTAVSALVSHATGHANRWVYASMGAGMALAVLGFMRRSGAA